MDCVGTLLTSCCVPKFCNQAYSKVCTLLFLTAEKINGGGFSRPFMCTNVCYIFFPVLTNLGEGLAGTICPSKCPIRGTKSQHTCSRLYQHKKIVQIKPFCIIGPPK